MEMQDNIRANAELVIHQMRQLRKKDFGYDEASVRWLDGYIERQRSRGGITEDTVEKLISVFGSYLGECIIHCFGGEWYETGDTWAVRFNAGNEAYPFNKVRKQFENGSEDSIAGFFTAIPLLFEKALRRQGPSKKPRRKFW